MYTTTYSEYNGERNVIVQIGKRKSSPSTKRKGNLNSLLEIIIIRFCIVVYIIRDERGGILHHLRNVCVYLRSMYLYTQEKTAVAGLPTVTRIEIKSRSLILNLI